MTIDQLPQISPASWGARIDYDAWPHRPIRQVFIHWLGSAAPAQAARGDLDAEAALLRSVERHHVNVKGWRGIAYDWAIGQSGVLYRLRGHGMSGGTSGDVDRDGLANNVEGDAVCVLIGEGQEASGLALHTLARVLYALDPVEGVWPHRDARGTATACPGDQLTRWTRSYRRDDQEVDVLTPEDRNAIADEVERRLLVHLSFRDRVHWDPARQVLGEIARKVGVPRSFLRRFEAVDNVAGGALAAAVDKDIVDPAANRGTVTRA